MKTGRNDPCPCGSGKKFKKCHFGKEDEILFPGTGEISMEMSQRITNLPPVKHGRSQEMITALDIEKLTGSPTGLRFIDLREYDKLDVSGRKRSCEMQSGAGGVVVNLLKTRKSDPDNIYIAISPKVGESILVHQIAHVLDYLGGSKLMPGTAAPLSFDLGIPVEHLEHPQEFGYWMDYLKDKFEVQLDADDTIILFLHQNGMLIKGEEIERGDRFALKSRSDRILRFLGEKSAEIDALICELSGYIGSRVEQD